VDRPLEGVRVLLVDDYADSLGFACLFLEQAGASALCVATAAEALEVVARGAVDVIVSDLAMPGEDGFWLAARVREHSAGGLGSAPRLIALTAHAQQTVTDQALQVGFEAVLTKPFTPEELVGVVAQVVA
jgi:CheY-like chemotaxis protein